MTWFLLFKQIFAFFEKTGQKNTKSDYFEN